MSDIKTNLVLQDGEALKCFMTIHEKVSGDLILHLRASEQIRAHGTLISAPSDDPLHGKGIKEYRYTVHVSEKSPTGINTINLKRVTVDDEELQVSQYTIAIKRENKFAPLYGRRCSSFNGPKYDVPTMGKARNVVVGDYDPKFTFVFAVFIGGAEREFKLSNLATDAGIRQLKHKVFRTVILYSYLTCPSHDSGSLNHIAPARDDKQTEGSDEEDCIKVFNVMRTNFRNEYIQLIGTIPEHAESIPVINASLFTKEPTYNTPQGKIFAARVRLLTSA